MCVFAGNHCVCLQEKVDGCLCVLFVYVCVRTMFVIMLKQFQVLTAVLETQCECCVVSVIVCVCLCVFQNPLCTPVRKIQWVFVCVSCVCVCRENVCEYVRAVPSVDGSAEAQCECCVASVTVCVYVCVCVFSGNHCVCLYEKVDGCICVFLRIVFQIHICECVRAVPSVHEFAGYPV